jgi:hypothetical protein
MIKVKQTKRGGVVCYSIVNNLIKIRRLPRVVHPPSVA